MSATDGPDKSGSKPIAAVRQEFNDHRALAIAHQLGLPPKIVGKGFSDRFGFFAGDTHLAVVAGGQEGDDVELALAYLVRHAEGRRTTIVLPEGCTNATCQRVPWLKPSARPAIYTHRGNGDVSLVPERSRPEAVQAVIDRLAGATPEEELARSMRPLHFGVGSQGVWRLVESATRDGRLDHGHRRGERSWHYAGQRVLSIRRTREGVLVTAGIHYSGANAPAPVLIRADDGLDREHYEEVWRAIETAIEARRQGSPPIHRPDEHWLQAIIRRDPSIVGVEQPALRELPAWRPRDSSRQWGRGFIDLVGLDGHGDIRIVETKLAKNADDLLVLQGLDYLVWATAYEKALRDRLAAAAHARFELHYVLGATAGAGKVNVSPCTTPLATALDPDAVKWRFQTVRDWFQQPDQLGRIDSTISAAFEVLVE